MKQTARTLVFALTAAVAASFLWPHAASAQSVVSVIVNGQPVNFDQPPVERAGRVFVPLRGVFEQLGASVVYANGQINATGNGRTISLNVGSTQAIVNGQQQYLDVAPFLIGARTLVPLRFVAQALGAVVAWNPNTSTVHITGGSTAYNPNPPNPGSNVQVALTNLRPNGFTRNPNPAIHANFSEPVRPGSVRVRIDGMDVTANAQIYPNGFDLPPSPNLGPGAHRVRVTGTARDGNYFSTGWTFTLRNY